MADWNEIKKNFTDWLKTNDANFNAGENNYTLADYGNKFKLFVESQDDENLNMDVFTKNNNQDKTLNKQMVDDFFNNLDKNSEVFKAIDLNKDGVICENEKTAFLEKIAGLDGDKNNLTLDDLMAAAQQIQNGNINFLGNNNPNNIGNQGGNQGANQGGNLGRRPELTDIQKINALSKVTVTYKPETITDYTSDIPAINNSINHDLTSIENNPDTAIKGSPDYNTAKIELEKLKTDIEGQIDTANSDFDNFSKAYTTASDTLQQASGYLEANKKEYNKTIEALGKNNQAILETNNSIATLQGQVADTTAALDVQYAAKDSVTQEIQATDAAISKLQATSPQGRTAAERARHKASIRSQISRLKAAKQKMQQELQRIQQEILNCKAVIDAAKASLNDAYDNLRTAIENDDTLDAAAKEQALAVVNNEKVIDAAKCDKASSQAGMVAMDASIQGLQSKLADTKSTMEDLGMDVPPDGAGNISDPKYPEGVAGLAQLPEGTDVEISQAHGLGENNTTYTADTIKYGDNTLNINSKGKATEEEITLEDGTTLKIVTTENSTFTGAELKGKNAQGSDFAMTTMSNGTTMTVYAENGTPNSEFKTTNNGIEIKNNETGITTVIFANGDTKVMQTKNDSGEILTQNSLRKNGNEESFTSTKFGNGTTSIHSKTTKNKNETTRTTKLNIAGNYVSEVEKKLDENFNITSSTTTFYSNDRNKTTKTYSQDKDGKTTANIYYEPQNGESVNIGNDTENNWNYNRYGLAEEYTAIKLENSTESSPDANVALLENAYTQVNNAKTTDPIEFKAENGKNYTLTYDSTNSSWLLKEKK